MENPFKNIFRKSNNASKEERFVIPDPLEQGKKQKIEKLQSVSPDAFALFNQLQSPALSKEEFFARIDEFNAGSLAKGLPIAGMYDEIHFDVNPTRRMKVKMFANGLITFSGSDHS